MSKSILRRTVRTSSSALILAALLSAAMLAHAGTKSTPPPAKPAPAAKPAAARPAAGARPSSAVRPGGAGSVGRTVSRPGATGASPSANRPMANGGTRTTGMPQRANGPSFPGHSAGFQRPAPGGGRQIVRPNGNSMRMRADGHPSDIHNAARGMDIHRGLNGGHRVMVERADHSRIRFERGRPGYVQHPYAFRGHDFARRTYLYHGRAYSAFYHHYAYRGGFIHVYAPGFYHSPAFYGWAYRPWGARVAFSWGFGGAPWYGYYGYYFAPYPSYASPAEWLTDYMISNDLQQAYTAHTEAGEVDGAAPPAAAGAPMLTPEVKQQIADEVRNQIALENQEAQQNAARQDINPGSSGIDRMLNDGRAHTYVVGSALDAEDAATQNACTLSDGDVLVLRPPTPADATTAKLVVVASKGGQECRLNSTVTVVMDDLQEMQNHMRQSIDQGLQELKDKQGKDGLPAVPETAQAQPVQAQYAAIAPPPDPNAAEEIQQQGQQADQAEREVTAEAAPAGGQQ